MRIIEAINRVDALKFNTYSNSEKVEWLSQLDNSIKNLIIDTHEGGEDVVFNGYDDTTDMNTVLLVPAPFDQIYLRWLESQIDYHNGEYGKYNNAVDMFTTSYEAFQNYYNRTHMPIGKSLKYF